MLLFLLNAVFRGAGDAAIAMRVLWIANAINIVLDPCLIFGLGPFPRARGHGSGRRHDHRPRRRRPHPVLGPLSGQQSNPRPLAALRAPPDALSCGSSVYRWAASCRFLIGTSSWVVLVVDYRRLRSGGGGRLHPRHTAHRIFAILPSWGLANAAATLVGQNLGADQPDRAEASVWLAGIYNMGFLLGVAVVFIAAAEPLIRIFSVEPDVVRFGVACLRWVSIGYPFYAWGMVMEQAFNGAGDTYTPTVINIFCYWIFPAPARLSSGLPNGPRTDRGLYRHHRSRVVDRGCRRPRLPPRPVEAAESLTRQPAPPDTGCTRATHPDTRIHIWGGWAATAF